MTMRFGTEDVAATLFTETASVSGCKVRIYTKDTGPHSLIHGAYQDPATENWYQASWQNTGYFHPLDQEQGQHKCSLDLVAMWTKSGQDYNKE